MIPAFPLLNFPSRTRDRIPSSGRRSRAMLRAMQQEMANAASGGASFAGLLADLTAPGPEPSAGDGDGLEDDVAVLSYERALQAHARYKPAVADPAEQTGQGSFVAPFADREQRAPATGPGSSGSASDIPDSSRSGKRASVTVRMSKAECARLQRRAAEAGMTVSAYLRSCTFEAESLRAQVKQALAELRAAQQGSRRPGWLRVFQWRRGTGAGR